MYACFSQFIIFTRNNIIMTITDTILFPTDFLYPVLPASCSGSVTAFRPAAEKP